MRFGIMFGAAALCVGLLIVIPTVAAQDGEQASDTFLPYGEWVEGRLTTGDYEHRYVFAGEAGSVILIEMLPKPGTYELDPALWLYDAEGLAIGQRDDFLGLDAVLVAELLVDGDYTIVATRSGGPDGISSGAYMLRVSRVDLFEPGDHVMAVLTAGGEDNFPFYYVLRPRETESWAIHFSQPAGDLFASIGLVKLPDENTVFWLGETAGIRYGTLETDLEAGQFYVLVVRRSLSIAPDSVTGAEPVAVNVRLEHVE
ncbi:MAG: hypothetical protein JW966_15375 [Anaerolineae bacterium]|nr:hypothetical protein [Anaerolineae bacterium]